jgi:hypothetical protein
MCYLNCHAYLSVMVLIYIVPISPFASHRLTGSNTLTY